MPYKDNTCCASHHARRFGAEYHVTPESFRCKAARERRPAGFHTVIEVAFSGSGFYSAYSQKGKAGNTRFWCISEARSGQMHKKSLESYLDKLGDERGECSSNSNSVNSMVKHDDRSRYLKATERLESLDMRTANDVPSDSGRETTGMPQGPSQQTIERGQPWRGKIFKGLRSKGADMYPKKSSIRRIHDDSLDLYLVGALVSINIAVFIFEIASPIKDSDYGFYSLPSMYGAKVNALIVIGEWWRLVTPMFLHAGLFHVALSCWVLLSLGPQVCKAYGWFTFFLIYILGGISGNLMSFLHTPDPTVGGSGPIFAIIGAWLIYQLQNKDVISQELKEKMFLNSVIATAASFPIGSFGPIDYWTHVGAVFTGILYGLLTCPVVQMDDASSSSKATKEEGILLVSRQANPCKSVTIFALFVLALMSLVFFYEPPVETMELEELLQVSE